MKTILLCIAVCLASVLSAQKTTIQSKMNKLYVLIALLFCGCSAQEKLTRIQMRCIEKGLLLSMSYLSSSSAAEWHRNPHENYFVCTARGVTHAKAAYLIDTTTPYRIDTISGAIEQSAGDLKVIYAYPGKRFLRPILISVNVTDTAQFSKKKSQKDVYKFNDMTGFWVNGQKVDIDSMRTIRYLLDHTFPTTNELTEWSTPRFKSNIFSNEGKMQYYFYLPPAMRSDVVLYYYLYYGLFGAKKDTACWHSIHIGGCDMADRRSSEEREKAAIRPYSKKRKPSNPSDFYLRHQCYLRWIKKVEEVGWEQAKTQELSPFDDYPCQMSVSPCRHEQFR